MLVKGIDLEEARELSQLCSEIYTQHYTHLWYDDGAWYKKTRYGAEILAQELADPHTRYYWVYLEKRKVGYLKLNLGNRPAEIAQPPESAGLEVERIYLDKSAAGTGLGKKVMQEAERIAIGLDFKYLFLYAMDSSSAVHFYEKLGYAKVGDKTLPFDKMKPEYRGMYLMIKNLV